MLTSYIPVILSVIGLFIGPRLATHLNNCPHRGRVWGAFLLPLFALAYSPLQLYALAVSLCAALASGFTAHKAFKVSLMAVAVTGLSATVLLEQVL